MSYQVLARKWRPSGFDRLAGQAHVRRALVNALQDGRLHHAYLFTGTRGVGKTTIARILAKCLNCEQGVGAEPCGECAACHQIDQGRFVDLIEVDAASRTRVEDTRELLDNVQYAPSGGRYKIYLIDEVHMLSGHSFNALLKTLEEPPPHVKFLLATTEPQKVPVTVLSRCLQFNLRRIPTDTIVEHLQGIAAYEGIEAEGEALERLARAADGSMRDALSLLDQALAFGGGSLAGRDVRDMLGAVGQEPVLGLLEAVASGDGGEAMRQVAAVAEVVPDFEDVLAELIASLHRLAVAQTVPAALEGQGDRAAVEDLASRLDPADVQLYYQIALTGRRDLPLAPDPRSGFEMILLRMLAFRPVQPPTSPGVAEAIDHVASGQATAESDAKQGTTSIQPSASSREAPQPGERSGGEDWASILAGLRLRGVAYALASNCTLRRRAGSEVELRLSPQHEDLRTENAEHRLQEALSSYLGEPIRLRIEVAEADEETPAQRQQRVGEQEQAAAREAIDRDSVVRALKETFGAEVVEGSVKPLNE